MELVAMVAALTLVEYMVFSYQTGKARAKYSIEAPATVGHPIFERHHRVQMNTLEQLIVFLPGLFLFALYVSEPIAAILGGVYIVGRLMYAISYVSDPTKRGPGFLLSYVPMTILIAGGFIGVAAASL